MMMCPFRVVGGISRFAAPPKGQPGWLFLPGVAGWFIEREDLGGHMRLLLATGILGGFTTFSAFSLDAVLLWDRHEHLLAALYVGGSVAGAIAGLVLGLWIMRTAMA